MANVMYIVGQISNESYITYENYSSLSTKVPSEDDIKNNIANIKNIDSQDIFVHKLNEQTDIDRVLKCHEFNVQWENSKIVGLDFSIEDNKPYLFFSADKNQIFANEVDTVIVSIQARQPDNSENVDTSVNTSLLINANTPEDPNGLYKFDFINGLASRSITTSKSGPWAFGFTKIDGYRKLNKISFNSYK